MANEQLDGSRPVGWRFASSGRASQLLASTFVMVALVTGVSGCSGTTTCESGSTTLDDAVRNFLLAVQNGDQAAAASQLLPRMELSDQELEQLRESLVGVDVHAALITESSETPDTYQISVAEPNGALVGKYYAREMTDAAPGCFAMNAGHPSAPDPGASVTPSAATTRL
jgi:hypothetical protein